MTKMSITKYILVITGFLSCSSNLQYKRLEDIGKYYPGEMFTNIHDNWCQDVKDDCELLAAKGKCNGTYPEVNH